MTTAPLLYRWCEAAVLFFAVLTALALLVPFVRGLARLLCAPCALCLISCVETVGVDIEVGDGGIAAVGDQFAGEGGGGGGVGGGSQHRSGMGQHKAKERADAAGVAVAMVLLGPCMLACMPCYYIFVKPFAVCFRAFCSPFGALFTSCGESAGCISFEDGVMSFSNPFAGMSFPGLAKGCAQVALAPGCIVPGRSLIALFVNTAALLWFFLYLAFILYDSWEVTCTRYGSTTRSASNPNHAAPQTQSRSAPYPRPASLPLSLILCAKTARVCLQTRACPSTRRPWPG